MAANMRNRRNTQEDESKARHKPYHHYRRSRPDPKPHPQSSPVVQDPDFITLLKDIAKLTYLIPQKENTHWEQIQENVSFLYSEQLNKDPQLAMSFIIPLEYRKCLFKLCHDMLWIEYHCPEQGAKFFNKAMAYLKQECDSDLDENAEYQYLLKLQKIKEEYSSSYAPFQQFESFVQDIESIGEEDKTKVYQAANIQMDKVLNPVVFDWHEDQDVDRDQEFNRLCAELSPKRTDKKVDTVLTCLKGLAVHVLGLSMQVLGLGLIGFSFASGAITGGLSLPLSLLGVTAGVGLFFLGSKVLEEGFALCSGALKAQDSRERLCEGLGTLRRSLGGEDLSASSSQENLSDFSSPVKNHSENGEWTWSLPNPLSWFRQISKQRDTVPASPSPFNRVFNSSFLGL